MTQTKRNNRSDTLPTLIANRYRVERKLGEGGMAVVYAANDTRRGTRIALKQMLKERASKSRELYAKLFEHEFNTLAQLAHPRVVEVYDYGVDKDCAYYTMELLDGGDLKTLSPQPWQAACSILRDVCSALSLLHSRRQVHRDLTPRNIRCTRDGKAKLIDFGAMLPIGPCKKVVGTPSFTAPEIFNALTIDTKADLYSLGATAYYALTGRYAYPARHFSQLTDCWRTPPKPPSRYVKDIPQTLDHLVLSLLSLDPLGRPANAAEVMEKLSAIASLETDEQLLVSRAYLTTPKLVGREREMERLGEQLSKSFEGEGGAVLITGSSGVGRSRLLDAHVLAAKLAGAVVLRLDASDAHAGPWSASKAMVQRLINAIPKDAMRAARPHLKVLSKLEPELAIYNYNDKNTDRRSSTGYPDEPYVRPSRLPKVFRPRLQTAMKRWLFSVARQRPLMLAVDDVHKLDEPSAALIALISRETKGERIAVSVTAEKEAPTSSVVTMKLLSELDFTLELDNLTLKDTIELFSSVFGDVPNVHILAVRIYVLSKGNPRDAMQIARHLLERGIIQYHSGTWSIPSNIETEELPASITLALRDRVDALSDDSLWLTECLCLEPTESFSIQELLLLTVHGEMSRLMGSLDELVASEVLQFDGARYSISQPGWVPVITEKIEPLKARSLRLRLASFYRDHGNDPFRAGKHLLHAGEENQAIDLLAHTAELSLEITSSNSHAYFELLQSLPNDWCETFITAIDLAKMLGRSPRQIFFMETRLSGLNAAGAATGNTSYLTGMFDRLFHESGLHIYSELSADMDSQERLKQALEIATQRYNASTDEKIVMDPASAIQRLARTLVEAAGFLATSYDFQLWSSLPCIEPLIPLSPALELVTKLLEAIGDRISGRMEIAREKYRELLDRIDQPDRAGLEETYHMYMQYGLKRGIGLLDAALGLETALRWAAEIEEEPSHEVNAWHIRMSYYLWQGNVREADICKHRVELLQIQNNPLLWFEGSHMFRNLAAYGLSDDLTGVKQSIYCIERLSKIFHSWIPTLHYARGEYQRIRGDYAGALEELDQALVKGAPGECHNWADAAGAYIRTLLQLGSYADAAERGREFLAMGEAAELGYINNYIKMPLAIAEAAVGDFEEASMHSDAALDSVKKTGASGLNLGLAYESRARVALLTDDRAKAETYARLCAKSYRRGNNPALIAKFEELMQTFATHDRQPSFPPTQTDAASFKKDNPYAAILEQALTSDAPNQTGLDRAVEMLMEHGKATGCLLYVIGKDGVYLSAVKGDAEPSQKLQLSVEDVLSEQIDDTKGKTGTHALDYPTTTLSETAARGEDCEIPFYPLIVSHHANECQAITGLALLTYNDKLEMGIPKRLVSAISRFLQNSGMASPIFSK